MNIVVGVVALQGAYQEHISMLQSFPQTLVKEVRKPEDLVDCDGLVIPGGESTVISRLAASSGLLDPLRLWTSENKPTWGTCAGLIMMADQIEGASAQTQELIGGMNCTVRRNYFGSQLGSFTGDITDEDGNPCQGVFIRAPAVMEMGENVKVLSKVAYNAASKEAFDPSNHEAIVAVQQGNLLGTSFHPELIPTDARWHAKFVQMVRGAKSSGLV